MFLTAQSSIQPCSGEGGVKNSYQDVFKLGMVGDTHNKSLLLQYWPRKKNEKFKISMDNFPNKILPRNKNRTADVRSTVEHLSSNALSVE